MHFGRNAPVRKICPEAHCRLFCNWPRFTDCFLDVIMSVPLRFGHMEGRRPIVNSSVHNRGRNNIRHGHHNGRERIGQSGPAQVVKSGVGARGSVVSDQKF
jgi:hypothetical protein